MEQEDNKNMILAMVLSAIVILVWMIFFPPEVPEPTPTDVASTTVDGAVVPNADGSLPAIVASTPAASRNAALGKSERLKIETARLSGSISLKGGRLDDLELIDYNVKLNDPSEKITLLSPAGGPKAYYTVYGWIPAGSLTYDNVPSANTLWSVESGETLTTTTPITLKWDNGAGLIFRRKISVDDNYLFDIEQSVENTTVGDVSMAPYGIIARKGEPETIGFYILHEGVVRNSDGVIQEIDYDDMPDQALDTRENANIDLIDVASEGWIGFTDKYWMTTLAPKTGQPFKSVSKYSPQNDTYQTDMRLPTMIIPAGQSAAMSTSLFAGAKEYDVIKDYQKAGVSGFIDSIDWGWFFFLTKPIFAVLHFMNNLIGNMGFAIIALTLVIKTLLFPLAYKSNVSMARMKALQPKIEELKEKHGEDKTAMQQGMMKLYKDEKVNPLGGCMPILLQIPIFFALYKVIFVTIEMYHAPFIGWIQDLSAPDPSSFLNLFGLLPWGTPDAGSFFAIFSIGVLPILMGVTMWMQQKLNPAPTDKTQAQIFAWMPWVFMFMLGGFAVGLVIYWVANNTITFTQQYLIMRSQGVKPDVWGNMFGFLKRKKDEA